MSNRQARKRRKASRQSGEQRSARLEAFLRQLEGSQPVPCLKNYRRPACLDKYCEDQLQFDREWFEQHPGEEAFVRPVFPGEIAAPLAQQIAVEQGVEAVLVRVVQIVPGVRQKEFICAPLRADGSPLR